MWVRLLSYGLAIMVMIGPSFGAAQSIERQVITAIDMQRGAFAALQNGDPARALALSDALLDRDENNIIALRIGAQAALALGEMDLAVRHGRALFHRTEGPDARFFAARLVALALVQQEKYTQAQVWLRRARQAAPDPVSAQSVASDFEAVQQRNPFHVTLDFGISPSSNVNNGSSEQTFDIVGLFGPGVVTTFPLSPSLQELSGLRVSASAVLRFRLGSTPTRQTVANFSAQTSQVFLSSESRALAPDFDNSSLSSWRLSTGLSHTWAVGPNDLPANIALSYGATIYDGDLLATGVRLNLARQWQAGDRTTLTSNLSFGQTQYRQTGLSANIASIGVAWRRALGHDHILGLSGEIGRSHSDAARYTYTWHSIGASYDFGRVADRFDVSFGAQYRERDYGSAPNTTVSREDEFASFSIIVGLPDVEFYGFSPIVTFAAAQNTSTNARFQTEAVTVDVGFRSNF